MRAMILLVVLVVGGCESGEDRAREACAGVYNASLAVWQHCMYEHREIGQTTSDADAAALLLGATALMNGYNQPRATGPAVTRSTCQWVAGMLQCTGW